jgi:magnesium-transporting ATPase (P-type)
MNNLTALLKNPHMLVVVILLAVLQIAAVWLPSCQPQFEHTRQIVLLYALAVAANTTTPTPKVNP